MKPAFVTNFSKVVDTLYCVSFKKGLIKVNIWQLIPFVVILCMYLAVVHNQKQNQF